MTGARRVISTLIRMGLPVAGSNAHHRVRARARTSSSLLRRSSVWRSEVAPPQRSTQVHATTSSPAWAGFR